MKWYSSPKGYTTSDPEGRRFTVFHRGKHWIGVEDGVYTAKCASVFGAIDLLEKQHGFTADRSGVTEAAPEAKAQYYNPYEEESETPWDPLEAMAEQRRRDAKFAGMKEEQARTAEAAKKAQDRARAQRAKDNTWEEARQRAKQQYNQNYREREEQFYEQFKKACSGGGQQRRATQRPEWAIVLKLPGNGPWKADFVKAQFRALSKKHHPDVGGQADQMVKILQAWATVRKLFNI